MILKRKKITFLAISLLSREHSVLRGEGVDIIIKGTSIPNHD